MITTDHKENRVNVTVLGEFTLADYKEFEELVNFKVKFEGPVNLLFDLRQAATQPVWMTSLGADGGVPSAERGEEVLEPRGQAGKVGSIGDDAVGAEDVMGIGGPFCGDDAAEDDVGRLLHRKLGPLDEKIGRASCRERVSSPV